MEDYSQAILLTGGRGVGKTTVCQVVAELARRRGCRPGGVITPALYSRYGAKVGLEAVDVGSGERWLLARTDPSTTLRQSSGQGSGHRRELGGPRVGPYSFDPDGLARALGVLRGAATAGCDLLVVDEIGPLELEQGEGFAPVLDLLPVEGPTHTLIVVRPALLDQLLLHLRIQSFSRSHFCSRRICNPPSGRWITNPAGAICDLQSLQVFSVTEENRDELPRRIVEELWGFEIRDA